uniref:cytochrome c oxidase subunit III n=1 Tax=Parasteatoda cingulata TaxID=2905676 RepID=UPI002237D7EF|nr:cytochrome c oxidase subunit III [Parasteatoda cingulata]UYG23918.1 cytochrome c oxidase subunit III [Parasteatoda cingulata]
MEKHYHPYHMVNMSPWPLLIGISILSFMLGMVKMFMMMEYNLVMISFLLSLVISVLWWRDVIRESTYLGYHSSVVLSGLMLGMILFIVSEVFFFISFFWSFFHSSLSPTIEIGSFWPPTGIETLNAFQVPLLNTVILLTSGVSVTLCHQAILNENWVMAKNSLLMTWLLGIYFLMLQGFEYMETLFGISDSVFGSTFFMATGFHGFHVIVGTLFLIIMWLRMTKIHFSSSHHFGFEAAAWYWHFVDVVWLFLFSVVYWWGS